MYYYLYEVKNKLDGKIYIGVHRTKNLDDGYMGSGSIIVSAVKKHGKENFTKTILEMFDNPDSMYAKEMEVVTDEFLKRSDTYNIKLGGLGGFDHINRGPIEDRVNIKSFRSKLALGEFIVGGDKSMFFTEESYEKIRIGSREGNAVLANRTEEEKNISNRKRSVSSTGEKNSQFYVRHFISSSGHRIKCKLGEEPAGYTSTRDLYENGMQNSKRRWFNDGCTSYMMASTDPRVVEFGLKPGRLSKLQAK